MKKSIRRQIATIFIALVCSILVISILINSQFLESYYIHNKQSTLIELYSEINRKVTTGKVITEETRAALSELVENGNITFVVIDQANAQTLTATPNDMKTKEMVAQLVEYLFSQNPMNVTVLKRSETYQIHSTRDRGRGGEYIEMWG